MKAVENIGEVVSTGREIRYVNRGKMVFRLTDLTMLHLSKA